MKTLYIVATPIGNMQDITIRAINILQSADVVVCEDTRRTGMLLQKVLQYKPKVTENEIKKPKLISYYEQNEFQRIPEIIALLKDGHNVALVSDAGTPAISDPGFKLIRECIKENIRVESIPGPSSVISSLVVSGLPTDKFLFLGYLPRKQGHRKKTLEDLTKLKDVIKTTIIIFEAPHRLIKTLVEVRDEFGDINIVVARELTKIYEEVIRESINGIISRYQKTSPKGEFVILFNFGN